MDEYMCARMHVSLYACAGSSMHEYVKNTPLKPYFEDQPRPMVSTLIKQPLSPTKFIPPAFQIDGIDGTASQGVDRWLPLLSVV